MLIDNYTSLIIFVVILVSIFGWHFVRSRKQDAAIETFIHLYNFRLKDVYKKYGVDVKYNKEIETPTTPGDMRLIGREVSKGYDFIHFVLKKDAKFVPPHTHKRVNEFFYLLSGKIILHTLKSKKPCSVFIPEDCDSSKTLNSGDWFYVEHGKQHCIEILQNSEGILVAQPPLFSRIGNFYEKIFKRNHK
jgi:mannose-6-phosphate isomerase-like protein (cupin superfamily)